MSLVDLLLVLVCVALTVVTWRELGRQQRTVAALRTAVLRQRAYRAERARFVAIREQFAGGTDRVGDVVNLPTAATRLGHETIAAIPFTVLENIPATAETSRVVREIHDEISGAVYDIISGTTRGITGALRRGFTGSPKRPEPDAVEQAVTDIAAEATDDEDPQDR